MVCKLPDMLETAQSTETEPCFCQKRKEEEKKTLIESSQLLRVLVTTKLLLAPESFGNHVDPVAVKPDTFANLLLHFG